MIRVLVVDDSAFMRKALATMLAGDPEIEVAGTARNGEEALELVRQLDPDVVTMDVEMPVMDGIELAHRAHSEFPAMKILLMTGYAEQRERADDLSAKIVDVVSKPFALPDIRKAVASALAG